MLNQTRAHPGIARESKFQGPGIIRLMGSRWVLLSNCYGEDDSDLVRRFAINEDATAKYPVNERADNVVDLSEYRRLKAAAITGRE